MGSVPDPKIKAQVLIYINLHDEMVQHHQHYCLREWYAYSCVHIACNLYTNTNQTISTK